MSEKKKVLEVDLKGADGNIFVVMGKSRSIIKRTKEKEMIKRVTQSKSYDEALKIINEYAEIRPL